MRRRDLAGTAPISAMGHQQPFRTFEPWSALPLRADLNGPTGSEIPIFAAHLGLLVTLLGIRFFASNVFHWRVHST